MNFVIWGLYLYFHAIPLFTVTIKIVKAVEVSIGSEHAFWWTAAQFNKTYYLVIDSRTGTHNCICITQCDAIIRTYSNFKGVISLTTAAHRWIYTDNNVLNNFSFPNSNWTMLFKGNPGDERRYDNSTNDIGLFCMEIPAFCTTAIGSYQRSSQCDVSLWLCCPGEITRHNVIGIVGAGIMVNWSTYITPYISWHSNLPVKITQHITSNQY